jgi:diketogulonate reductase-like aldo/keto reductase
VSDLTPDERRQRIQQSLATLREILSPEDRKAIAEAARQARREDFPEDFEDSPATRRARCR